MAKAQARGVRTSRVSPRFGGLVEGHQQDYNPGMAWIYLVGAGLFEVGWAIGLKFTEGFTRLWPSLWTALAMGVSLFLLGQALRTLPVGTGYAIWTGIGSLGTALLGILLLGESREPLRLVCLALILSGIVGLKLVTETN
jgi:quaternary ammonium compound-resistance protein SugE